MPFSEKTDLLFYKADNTNTAAFREFAIKTLDENPAIVEEKNDFSASPLLTATLSLYKRREMSKNVKSEHEMQQMIRVEDNLRILVGILLEKKSDPNLSWVGNVKRTATDYFIQLLELHLKIESAKITVNDNKILLAKYIPLTKLFVKQNAQFKLDQCEKQLKEILSKFIKEVGGYIVCTEPKLDNEGKAEPSLIPTLRI